MTEDQFRAEFDEHTEVHKRVLKMEKFLLELNRAHNAEKLKKASFSRGIHACFVLYRYDLEAFINFDLNRNLPDAFFPIYKARKAMRLFLDLINMFEAQIGALLDKNPVFSTALEKKLQPEFESIDKNWIGNEKVKDGLAKGDIDRMVGRKRIDSSMRRRVMYNLGWISKEDFEILDFMWFFRNCMHNDFTPVVDRAYSFHDLETQETILFEFKKDQIIVAHVRHIYGLAERLSKILLQIVDKAFENIEDKYFTD